MRCREAKDEILSYQEPRPLRDDLGSFEIMQLLLTE